MKTSGIFPACHVSTISPSSSKEQAEKIYYFIHLKLCWNKFIQNFAYENPSRSNKIFSYFKEFLHSFNYGLVHQIGDMIGETVMPFKNGVVSDWRDISFIGIKSILCQTSTQSSPTSHEHVTDHILSIQVHHLHLGLDFKDGSKGCIFVYLFDEVKGVQFTETAKLTFTVDKHGRLSATLPIYLMDVKKASAPPSLYILFKVAVTLPINEQKKTTQHVLKTLYWGCCNLKKTLSMDTNSPDHNTLLMPHHMSDKQDYISCFDKFVKSSCNKVNFLSYSLTSGLFDDSVVHDVYEDVYDNCGIKLYSRSEILRQPPMTMSRLNILLHSGVFEKGKKTSEKNIQVVVSVVNDEDDVMPRVFVEGTARNPYYRSGVTRHSNNPHWYEMITIIIRDSDYQRCHIKFECSHVTSSELTHKSSLAWVTYAPLTMPLGNVLSDGTYVLKLFPKNSYFNKAVWEEEVWIKESRVDIQKIKIITSLESSTLTENPSIFKLKDWGSNSKDLKLTLQELNKSDFSKCVVHCKQIFDTISEILDTCVDGAIIALCMDTLFSFNRFWNTNDMFKQQLTKIIEERHHSSCGLMKIVSWIQFVFQDLKSSRLRQTIKCLPMLTLMMSKSFVHLQKEGVISGEELQKYKVVLANALVKISSHKIEGDVILSSQIIKAYPQALRILYNDHIISINEFSFHMITSIKGSLTSFWKDSAESTCRQMYLEHLEFIVDSDFMTKVYIQSRYLGDILIALHINQTFSTPDVILMGNILVKLCDVTSSNKDDAVLNQLIVEKLYSFIEEFSRREEESSSSSFIIVYLALFDELLKMYPRLPLSQESSFVDVFKKVVGLVRPFLLSQINASPTTFLKHGNSQIGRVLFCKELFLSINALDFSLTIQDMDVKYDVTLLSASLIAQPPFIMDKSFAPYFSLLSRQHNLSQILFLKIQANCILLCYEDKLQYPLLLACVAVGLRQSSFDWLFSFIDTFLSKHQQRLTEVLEAVHEKREFLPKAKLQLEQCPQIDSSSKVTVVWKQMLLLSEQTTGRHLFLKIVLRARKLVKFYSKHKVWDAFHETAEQYQAVLVENGYLLEAAEMIVYASIVSPRKLRTGKELFTAAQYYQESGMHMKALEILKTLQLQLDQSKTKHHFLELSKVSQKQNELYTHLATEVVVPFHYFLVGIYGREIDKDIRNKMFVFKGGPLESVMEFTNRLIVHIPGCKILTSAKLPTEEEQYDFNKTLQVMKIEPDASGDDNEFRIDAHDSFSITHCSIKDLAIKDEFLRMLYQRNVIKSKEKFPSFVPFCEISSLKQVTFHPIQMAIEQTQMKTTSLRKAAKDVEEDSKKCLNPFQMQLNGIIDAAVNGGVAKLETAFFSDEYIEDNPGHEGYCTQLKEAINEQNVILEECLKIHNKVCPANLRMLHDKMVSQFYSKQMPGPGGEFAILPERNAFLQEISQNKVKLSKSKKKNLKRISSYFKSTDRNQNLYSNVVLSIDSNDSEISPSSSNSNILDALVEESDECFEFERIYQTIYKSVGPTKSKYNSQVYPDDLDVMELVQDEVIIGPEIVQTDRGHLTLKLFDPSMLIEEEIESPLLPAKIVSPTADPPSLPVKKSKRKTCQPLTQSLTPVRGEEIDLTLNTPDMAIRHSSLGQMDISNSKRPSSTPVQQRRLMSMDLGSPKRQVDRSARSSLSDLNSPQRVRAPLSATPPDLDLKLLASTLDLSVGSGKNGRITKRDFCQPAAEKKRLSLQELREISSVSGNTP